MNKFLIGAAGALLLSQVSFGYELNCWKTSFRQAHTPYLTAQFRSNKKLNSIEFRYRDSGEQNATKPITGTLITSNRSPYKGNVEYILPSKHSLILPKDLSNTNLEAVEKEGLYYKDENGVLIGWSEDSDAGNHYSVRLSCRSDK